MRRWHLAVAAGLLVGPFFPAANVLFYVGTFIGERLLYLPSGRFCFPAVGCACRIGSGLMCSCWVGCCG